MFGLGLPELVLILVVVLFFFGPRRLPQLGQAIGASIKGFKRGTAGDDPPGIPDTEKGRNSTDGHREDPRAEELGPENLERSSRAHI